MIRFSKSVQRRTQGLLFSTSLALRLGEEKSQRRSGLLLTDLYLDGPSVVMSFPQENQSKDPNSRPLRLAVASTGLSKQYGKYVGNNPSWQHVSLENLAKKGGDPEYLCGEDALASGYITTSGASSLEARTEPVSPPATPAEKVKSAAELVEMMEAGNWPDDPYFRFGYVTHNVEKQSEPITKAGFAVADGVGGMMTFGKSNDTPILSHDLVDYARDALWRLPTNASPKQMMQDAWNRITSTKGKYRHASSTYVVGTIQPDPSSPTSPSSSTTDLCRPGGNLYEMATSSATGLEPDASPSLRFKFANIGDSSIVAFRPGSLPTSPAGNRQFLEGVEPGDLNDVTSRSHSHLGNLQPTNATPLAHSWPMYHEPAAPGQPAAPCQLTIMPQNRQQVRLLEAGRHISDEPWMAQEGTAQLQRGDVVVVMSDGIGDNLGDAPLVRSLPSNQPISHSHWFTHPNEHG